MMPMKIINEIPLPMPRSVIFSPSHMINIVPLVKVIIVRNLKNMPGFGTTARPEPVVIDSKNMAVAAACKAAINTVP